MANLKIRVSEYNSPPQPLTFQKITDPIPYIRSEENVRDYSVVYSNASGQSYNAGDTLFSLESAGSVINVYSMDTVTINGNGELRVLIKYTPSASENRGNIVQFMSHGSLMEFALVYNTKPETFDITKNVNAESVYVFSMSDFTSHYYDYDGDAMIGVEIFYEKFEKELTTPYGLFYNNQRLTSPYLYISAENINNGLLKFVAGTLNDSISFNWNAKQQ